MKTEFLKGVAMLLLIVALAFVTAVASNAQALNQPANRLVFDIPFAFSVDYKTLPAGEYTVQTVASAGDAILIKSVDGNISTVRHAEAIELGKEKTSARLVFHRYGQRYFLAEVWHGNDKNAGRLVKSNDELALERDLAGIVAKIELAQGSYEQVELLAMAR